MNYTLDLTARRKKGVVNTLHPSIYNALISASYYAQREDYRLKPWPSGGVGDDYHRP